MNENENIPGADVQAEDEEQLALNFITACEIYAADQYDKPKFTLSKNGIGFAPLGNIMAICAEMKMGKSWLMQQLACAILKGEYMGLTCDMTDTRILYFDTEQDKYDSQMVMRRIQYVNGWDFKTDNDRFRLFSLRDFEKMEQGESIARNRLLLIKAAIEHYRPTVAFIDGVRDLIDDFNDLNESADLVQELMSLTTQTQCSIWCVLHVNPNSDKMRGHLGTELGNKTTDVFSVHKDKDPMTGEVTFEVKQVAARHRDVDDWLFRIDDTGKFSVPVLLDATEAYKTTLKLTFNKAFQDHDGQAMNWGNMYDLIHKVEKKRKETIVKWIQDGIKFELIHSSCGKYYYNINNVTEAPF